MFAVLFLDIIQKQAQANVVYRFCEPSITASGEA